MHRSDRAALWVFLCLLWGPARVLSQGPGKVGTPVPFPPATIYLSERRDLPTEPADSLPRVLYVALPSTYHDSTTKRYPVVYVLDGDGIFGLTSDVARLLAFGREIPDVIVVGLAHGRPFLETPPFRWRNFTPTAVADHPGTGHAAELLAYLAHEVVPFVDSSYRTIAGDRAIVGASRSGLFVLYAMYEQPALFRRVLAASPEARWDNDYLLRRDSAFAASSQSLPVSAYVSIGELELQRPFGVSAREFGTRLTNRRYRDSRVVFETLPGENHATMPGVAITHGLKAIFAIPDGR